MSSLINRRCPSYSSKHATMESDLHRHCRSEIAAKKQQVLNDQALHHRLSTTREWHHRWVIAGYKRRNMPDSHIHRGLGRSMMLTKQIRRNDSHHAQFRYPSPLRYSQERMWHTSRSKHNSLRDLSSRDHIEERLRNKRKNKSVFDPHPWKHLLTSYHQTCRTSMQRHDQWFSTTLKRRNHNLRVEADRTRLCWDSWMITTYEARQLYNAIVHFGRETRIQLHNCNNHQDISLEPSLSRPRYTVGTLQPNSLYIQQTQHFWLRYWRRLRSGRLFHPILILLTISGHGQIEHQQKSEANNMSSRYNLSLSSPSTECKLLDRVFFSSGTHLQPSTNPLFYTSLRILTAFPPFLSSVHQKAICTPQNIQAPTLIPKCQSYMDDIALSISYPGNKNKDGTETHVICVSTIIFSCSCAEIIFSQIHSHSSAWSREDCSTPTRNYLCQPAIYSISHYIFDSHISLEALRPIQGVRVAISQ